MSAHLRWEQKASQRRETKRERPVAKRERSRPKSGRGRDLASVSFYTGTVMESALPTFNQSLPVTCRLKFGLIDPALAHINKIELKIKK
jgi:hypothetical protein